MTIDYKREVVHIKIGKVALTKQMLYGFVFEIYLSATFRTYKAECVLLRETELIFGTVLLPLRQNTKNAGITKQ